MEEASDLPRTARPPPSARDDYAFYWLISDTQRCSREYFYTAERVSAEICRFEDLGSVLMSGDPLDLCPQPAGVNQ